MPPKSQKRYYLDFLADLHEIVRPEFYFEIGIREGRSLALARRRAVGVDPRFDLTHELSDDAETFETTSDDFFAHDAPEVFGRLGPPQLALIDGMHLSEFALRDFVNLERWSKPDTVIAIDDVLPTNRGQADRVHGVPMWAGDVWKVIPMLRAHRPDLTIDLADTRVTGVAVITDLDPTSHVLTDMLPELEAEIAADRAFEAHLEGVLERRDAVAADQVCDNVRRRMASS